ncbi:hypothetical protein GCM10027447_12250 [Glycomyces halotolerans]
MAEIKNPHTQEVHTGRTPETITRRVWGRKAELILSPDPNSRFGDAREGMVVEKTKYGSLVLANPVLVSE